MTDHQNGRRDGRRQSGSLAEPESVSVKGQRLRKVASVELDHPAVAERMCDPIISVEYPPKGKRFLSQSARLDEITSKGRHVCEIGERRGDAIVQTELFEHWDQVAFQMLGQLGVAEHPKQLARPENPEGPLGRRELVSLGHHPLRPTKGLGTQPARDPEVPKRPDGRERGLRRTACGRPVEHSAKVPELFDQTSRRVAIPVPHRLLQALTELRVPLGVPATHLVVLGR